jgi:excisionase family DNA binding protein
MPDQSGPDRLLTIPETCQRLRWSRTWVYQSIRSGALPSILLGPRSRRVRERDLIAFIEARAATLAKDGAA